MRLSKGNNKKYSKFDMSKSLRYQGHNITYNIVLRFILIFSSKRGIDFGLGRGFSGSQAAKHFMGMAAARYSGGPGKKKKRSQY